ncbi:MAG: mandelate racemase/muconate lactonizing enzyme family protein [Candidatus Latescibacteria bacterium]|jgi:galactonate dehydratase|nr:mandelate racemase/muconate lactonizing enzyme family protein [Candidatus Latescibacterota bacterium]
MKITRVETLRSPCRNYCWILITTDNGIVGLGETYHRADPAETVIHEFANRYLLGSNPEDIEKLWYNMYRAASYHGMMGAELRAISGIDMALWDLLGKALDRPVFRILGGKTHDNVPVYFSGIYDEIEMRKDAVQDWSRECVDAGWQACKTARFFRNLEGRPSDATGFLSVAQVEQGARRFEWVRDAVGGALEVGLDLHCYFDVPAAIRIGEAVRPYNPYFIEEPIQPHNVTALREVRERTGVPIAAGERIFSRWGFQQILEERAADVLNPDLAWTGGITELKKIADYAAIHYIPVAPHNYGPITCMALTHLMAVIPNTRHLEFTAFHYPQWNTYIDEPIVVEEGHLPLPERPGLGRELSREMLELPRISIEAE